MKLPYSCSTSILKISRVVSDWLPVRQVEQLQEEYRRYEQLPGSQREREQLQKELSSIEWQIEELDRAIAVAERDPVRFSVDAAEIDRRRLWTNTTRHQIGVIKRSLLAADDRAAAAQNEASRRELTRMAEANGVGSRGPAPDRIISRDNQDFIESEDDRQALIIRVQDQHLDDMSISLAKIGSMGIAIHDELGSQDKLITDLTSDVEVTNTRMGLVQKKMQQLMKKAGVKGQLCMIVALIVLLFILLVLIFYT